MAANAEVALGEICQDLPPSGSCLEVVECWLALEPEPAAVSPPLRRRVLYATYCFSLPASLGGRRYRCSCACLELFLCVRLSFFCVFLNLVVRHILGRPCALVRRSRKGDLLFLSALRKRFQLAGNRDTYGRGTDAPRKMFGEGNCGGAQGAQASRGRERRAGIVRRMSASSISADGPEPT